MQVRQLKTGNFRREALSTQLGRKFITVSVHVICLQHVRRDAARREGLSATADLCRVNLCRKVRLYDWERLLQTHCVHVQLRPMDYNRFKNQLLMYQYNVMFVTASPTQLYNWQLQQCYQHVLTITCKLRSSAQMFINLHCRRQNRMQSLVNKHNLCSSQTYAAIIVSCQFEFLCNFFVFVLICVIFLIKIVSSKHLDNKKQYYNRLNKNNGCTNKHKFPG